MAENKRNYRNKQHQISCVAKTDDRLTGRAGLTLFTSYLHSTETFSLIDEFFGRMRKTKKGATIVELFKQALCFHADGTSSHLTYFDQLKKDAGYAGAIETNMKDMASSHVMKRFFKKFAGVWIYWFRIVLQRLFIWRLKLKQPDIIELGIDTMVMDNDGAKRRHGVKPTYKKKKGFQPLQMNWGGLFVDAVFRGGNRHSNYSDTVEKMTKNMVKKIRSEYKMDVPIIIRMDSGFFDQKIFAICEKLGVGYICGGKMYKDIKQVAEKTDNKSWRSFHSPEKKDRWDFIEFGSKRKTWKKFRRAIYCRLANIGKQLQLPEMRPDTVIITNLGMGGRIDKLLHRAKADYYFDANHIVASYHERGSDELANRGLKDFGSEKLPFKRFNPNAAWYYVMLIGHFLFECFKEDAIAPVTPVISVSSYASTVRRKIIDIAGKIVKHSGKITLKVSTAIFESLKFAELFARCNNAPPIK